MTVTIHLAFKIFVLESHQDNIWLFRQQMKQIFYKSEKAMRHLTDKLLEIVTKAHTTLLEFSVKFRFGYKL